MLPNAGMWDALAALEWTKKYISQFGGDPEKITAMGESAGGGIVDHMITAWGGNGNIPFHQVMHLATSYYFCDVVLIIIDNFDLAWICATCGQRLQG